MAVAVLLNLAVLALGTYEAHRALKDPALQRFRRLIVGLPLVLGVTLGSLAGLVAFADPATVDAETVPQTSRLVRAAAIGLLVSIPLVFGSATLISWSLRMSPR